MNNEQLAQPSVPIYDAVAFVAFLIDNHERQSITEEDLQVWLSEFIAAHNGKGIVNG